MQLCTSELLFINAEITAGCYWNSLHTFRMDILTGQENQLYDDSRGWSFRIKSL